MCWFDPLPHAVRLRMVPTDPACRLCANLSPNRPSIVFSSWHPSLLKFCIGSLNVSRCTPLNYMCPFVASPIDIGTLVFCMGMGPGQWGVLVHYFFITTLHDFLAGLRIEYPLSGAPFLRVLHNLVASKNIIPFSPGLVHYFSVTVLHNLLVAPPNGNHFVWCTIS